MLTRYKKIKHVIKSDVGLHFKTPLRYDHFCETQTHNILNNYGRIILMLMAINALQSTQKYSYKDPMSFIHNN